MYLKWHNKKIYGLKHPIKVSFIYFCYFSQLTGVYVLSKYLEELSYDCHALLGLCSMIRPREVYHEVVLSQGYYKHVNWSTLMPYNNSTHFYVMLSQVYTYYTCTASCIFCVYFVLTPF